MRKWAEKHLDPQWPQILLRACVMAALGAAFGLLLGHYILPVVH
jgi:hypothetical protein